jgi:hypothetical protein
MLHLSRILKKRLIFIFFGNIFINKQTLNGLCLNQFKQGEIMQVLSMKTPTNYFTVSEAKFICNQNNSELEEWTYKIIDVGNAKNLVVIGVYEGNQFLGYF